MPEGVGVPISPEKFIELYRTIPQTFRDQLIPSHDLVNLNWNSGWRRCTVWQKGSSAVVYLIDERNRIMQDVTINIAFVSAVSNYGQQTPGRLDDNPEFSGSIYSSESFFKAFFELLQEERVNFLPDSDILLSVVKPVTQVGLKQTEDIDGYGMVGFESIGKNGYFVTQYPVPAGPMSTILVKMIWQSPESFDSAVGDSIPANIPDSPETERGTE